MAESLLQVTPEQGATGEITQTVVYVDENPRAFAYLMPPSWGKHNVG